MFLEKCFYNDLEKSDQPHFKTLSTCVILTATDKADRLTQAKRIPDYKAHTRVETIQKLFSLKKQMYEQEHKTSPQKSQSPERIIKIALMLT